MKRSKRPTTEQRRRSSTLHYQTFPTKPPTSRGRPLSVSPGPNGEGSESHDSPHGTHHHNHHESPLPKRQLAMLAFIALAEQTALNSISPYLPDMAGTFPEVKEGEVGLYVGLIASSFALAQFATNFFWGWASDRIGRKPVILLGTLLTSACFFAFGFCRTLWQAILVQIFMGLVNGNQGVVSTCLGEITDRSNQSRAFMYLPVVYGIGGITGPVVGGLLVTRQNPFNKAEPNPYPYLLPNMFAAIILLVDLVLTSLFLDESLDEAQDLPPLGKRIKSLFAWMWQFAAGSVRPSYLRTYIPGARRGHDEHSGGTEGRDQDTEVRSDSSLPAFLPDASGETLTKEEVFNRDTILLLITFLIFQLSNISYNSLYPIFAEAHPPIGRGLTPEEVGLSLGFAGAVTIIFQVGIYGRVRDRIGNKNTYRLSLALFVATFVFTPFVGYKDESGIGMGKGKGWLWFELGVVLIIKTVAAVGGLTSALLMITNSAPNHSVLGTLNGLAATLSAAGRAVGPFISGGLFTAATHVQPKGEALAFGVFGGIACLGFFMSFGIRGEGLEAEGWSDDECGNDSDKDDEEAQESSPLVGRH